MHYLVLNYSEGVDGETIETPIFCITKVEDYYYVVERGIVDNDLCPINSWNCVVTLH